MAGADRTSDRVRPCYNVTMSEAGRRARAQGRQARAILRKTRLQAEEADLSPIRGAEAISLLSRLTREGWELAGLDEPTYTRDEIPCRFVPGRLT